MAIEVEKRNGRRELLNVGKIHKAVQWACDGLDVSLSEIETGAHIQFFNGIKTSDIQSALIGSAASLIDVDTPDYEYAAARLMLLQIYKEAGMGEVSYLSLDDYVAHGIEIGRLSPELAKFDLEELDKGIDPERDMQFKYLGMQTVYDRYLIQENPEVGSDRGRVIEMPQHMWMRIAMGLALNELSEERTFRAIQFYDILSKFEFVSSTPTLFNSGTTHPQMSSCFVNTVQDAIWERSQNNPIGDGIFGTITECALLSKFAGGIGTDWTRVRPTGSHIKSTNGTSSGIVPYLKVFNDTAVAVNQSFTPDTMLVTKDGFKRIEDVVSADLLMNGSGDFREIEKIKSYDQHDPVVSVKFARGIEPVEVTSGHRFLVVRGIRLRESFKRVNWNDKKTEWVEAKDLLDTDMLCVAQPSPNSAHLIHSEDDCRMYGVMIGDGHVKKDRYEAGVSLGIDGKSDVISFVRSYLKSKSVHSWETVDGKCQYISWNSRDLPAFSRNSLYDKHGEKRICGDMLNVPPTHAIFIIQGMLETDGYYKKSGSMNYVTTSRNLAESFRFLCTKFGVLPTGYRRKISGGTFTKRCGEKVKRENCKDIYEVSTPIFSEISDIFDVPKTTTFQGWYRLESGALLNRVRSVTPIDYSGYVYDFEMDGPHSYSISEGIVHNGGKRNGSFAAYLEPWHGDIERFLSLKKPNGDERLRAREIFPALWTNDLFMERVRDQKDWSLFDSHEYPELHQLHGDDFKIAYEQAEADGGAIRTVNAEVLWRKIITALVESGAPWITFKDEFNRRNPQKHIGSILSSNLCCMTADQRVVTDAGIMTVGELYASERSNKVVGLSEFSDASKMLLPRPNAPIVQINTAEGYEHKVTPDHRVWVRDKGWVEAQDLESGDKLLTQQIEGMFGEQHFPKLALIAGLVAGDGTFSEKAGSTISVHIDLWGEKTGKFVPVVEKVVESLICGEVASTSSVHKPKFSFNHAKNSYRLCSAPLARVLDEMGFNKQTKLDVPDFVWKGTRSTVMGYLRGLYLTDGNIQVGKDATCMALSSSSRDFLRDIQILWANFGVKSSMNKVHNGGMRDFGDGYGEYECKTVWRLLITSIQGCQIAERVTMLGKYRTGDGADTFVSNLSKKGYKQKLYATFTDLTELPNEDAYCLTVDSETHAWTVNGLITHNTEIALNTSDDETAVCNLGSINISVVKPHMFSRVIPIAMRMLDNVIDLNFYPTEKARATNMKHRPVGLGLMGWADYIVEKGIDWESIAHLKETDNVFEQFSYWAISGSVDLAQERGAYESFKGSNWDEGIFPIDTARELPSEWSADSSERVITQWDTLRARLEEHGIRNSNCTSLAPTATISNLVGTEPCIEPPFKQVSIKENKSGKFKVVAPSLRHGRPELVKVAFNIDQKWIIRPAAVRQKWLCQSQSVNLFKKLGVKGSVISSWYFLAWELGLKSTYYLKQQINELTDEEAGTSLVKQALERLEKPVDPVGPVEVDGEKSLDDMVDGVKVCSISNPECESCQ